MPHKAPRATHRKPVNEQRRERVKLYDRRWAATSKAFLDQNPLCCLCMAEGKVTVASVTDHKQPHLSNYQLFWDESNWQPLCEKCHNRKSAIEKKEHY